MVSKLLLPLLGGGPSIWNTAMVFFQAMLLGGYAYAHGVAKYVPLTLQGFLHLALLLVFALVLPLALPAGLLPPEDDGQAWWQLGVMLACIGGPFFILAASAPLFQHWFSASGHKDSHNPYFLYAVSNAGSMAALLGYPVVFEPFLSLSQQSWGWFAGYGILIVLTAICAFLVRRGQKPVASLGSVNERSEITWKARFIWIGLAFIPSSLMLGVTTLITTDLVSAPFIWILPLALYLATFIIAFSKRPVISVYLAREISGYAICLIVLAFTMAAFVSLRMPIVLAHLAAFFICAQLCHGELARLKPSASNLTEFFLLISTGGVLGGIFNALVAPQIFLMPLEYSITLGAVCFVIWAGAERIPALHNTFNAIEHKHRLKKLFTIDAVAIGMGIGIFLLVFFTKSNTTQIFGSLGIFAFLVVMVRNRFVFAMTAPVALLLFQSSTWNLEHRLLVLDRNYFGVLKVYETQNKHFFYHGTTLHGAQSQDEKERREPVTYYSKEGPTSDAFAMLDKRGGVQKIAALGLGVGSIACYSAQQRMFDFYEIDSNVVKIAKNPAYFSYLSDCGNNNIILGDARLKIQNAPDYSYDMIFVDTFSSDNIPVHIITKEAFLLYLQKLKPDGFIIVNISNRYFNLRPVLQAVSNDLGMSVYFKTHQPQHVKGEISELYAASSFAVLAPSAQSIAEFVENYEWMPYTSNVTVHIWTDDYANILATMNAR